MVCCISTELGGCASSRRRSHCAHCSACTRLSSCDLSCLTELTNAHTIARPEFSELRNSPPTHPLMFAYFVLWLTLGRSTYPPLYTVVLYEPPLGILLYHSVLTSIFRTDFRVDSCWPRRFKSCVHVCQRAFVRARYTPRRLVCMRSTSFLSYHTSSVLCQLQ